MLLEAARLRIAHNKARTKNPHSVPGEHGGTQALFRLVFGFDVHVGAFHAFVEVRFREQVLWIVAAPPAHRQRRNVVQRLGHPCRAEGEQVFRALYVHFQELFQLAEMPEHGGGVEDRARAFREFRISRFGKPEPLFRQISFHDGDALKRPRFHDVRTKQEMQVVHEPGPRTERAVRTGQAIDRHFGAFDKFLEEIAAEKTGRAGEQHAGPSGSRGRGKIRHVQCS